MSSGSTNEVKSYENANSASLSLTRKDGRETWRIGIAYISCFSLTTYSVLQGVHYDLWRDLFSSPFNTFCL